MATNHTRRIFAWAAAALLLLVCCACARPTAPDEPPVLLYFYNNPCETCDDAEVFRQAYPGDIRAVRFSSYNLFTMGGQQEFERRMRAINADASAVTLPAVLFGGIVYAGDELTGWLQGELPQRASLPDEAAAPPETAPGDSLIVLLTAPGCEACASVKLHLTDAQRLWPSDGTRLHIYSVDISGDAALARAYFSAYHVPDEAQRVPIVFFRDGYLSGEADITQHSVAWLAQKRAVDNAPQDIAAQDLMPQALSALGALVAGLVGGLNPCSLSMLLFFLSLLLTQSRRMGWLAGAFVLGKLAAYLLLSTVLYGLYRLLDPVYLATVSRVLITAVTLPLAALNLFDFFAVRSERYGRVRLQLPRALRRFNHEAIRRAVTSSRALPLVCFGLGALVFSGEFLCTGQVYLASLLTLLRTSLSQAFWPFLCYAAGFMLPPIIVTAVLARTGEVLTVSERVRSWMPAIKLTTAVFMLAALVAAWLV